MPDPKLHGNGEDCPACALRREDHDQSAVLRPVVPCNLCGSTTRVPVPVQEIVRREVEHARLFYWPERLKRWEEQGVAQCLT